MANNLKMNDFLLLYFQQMHFNNMPPAQRAQFDAYLKNDDFRGHMKGWKELLMHVDRDGNLKENEIPTAAALADKELEKLYIEFRDAFRNMAANKKTFANDIDLSSDKGKVKDFFNEYFGDTKLFTPAQPSPEAKTQINDLIAFLKQNKPSLQYHMREWGFVNQQTKYDDFVKKLEDGDYIKDQDFFYNMSRLAEKLAYQKDDNDENNPLKDIKDKIPDLTRIPEAFNNEETDPNRLEAFKTEFDIILRKIYRTKDIREAFPSDKVKNAYEKAKGNVDYDNKESKDYIPPKRDDKLNPWQQVSKWAGNTYEDTFAKYIKFTGDRMYFSPQAKSIVEALHKAKIKPTDGLDGVLKNVDGIKKELLYKSPKATDHFDWTIKTLNDLKDTMPKAFAGALQNGRQMRALIQEMIVTAVREGKVEEAKSAMEVMSVIKYGYTTSKTMDALKGVEVSIFSDGNLSWNKNEGMAFVSKALDKSIKYAFLGLGYGITMTANAINLSGSKFKGKRDDKLKKVSDDWANENTTAKQNAEDARRQKNATDNQAIQRNIADQNDVNRGYTANQHINDSNLQQKEDAVTQEDERLRNERERLKNDREQLNTDKQDQNYLDAKANVDKVNKINTKMPEWRQKDSELRAEIQQLDNDINNIQNNAQMIDAERQFRINQLLQKKQDAENELNTIVQSIQNGQNDLATITGNQNWANQQNIVNQMVGRENVLEQRDQTLNTQQQLNNDLNSRVTKWKNAQKNIEELNEQIRKRDEEIDNWDDNHKDQYQELMAHWDMLETGRNTRTGKMYNWGGRGLSAKSAQGRFDAKKQQYINDYLSNYSYTS